MKTCPKCKKEMDDKTFGKGYYCKSCYKVVRHEWHIRKKAENLKNPLNTALPLKKRLKLLSKIANSPKSKPGDIINACNTITALLNDRIKDSEGNSTTTVLSFEEIGAPSMPNSIMPNSTNTAITSPPTAITNAPSTTLLTTPNNTPLSDYFAPTTKNEVNVSNSPSTITNSPSTITKITAPPTDSPTTPEQIERVDITDIMRRETSDLTAPPSNPPSTNLPSNSPSTVSNCTSTVSNGASTTITPPITAPSIDLDFMIESDGVPDRL